MEKGLGVLFSLLLAAWGVDPYWDGAKASDSCFLLLGFLSNVPA